jgi:hypothetical protein
MQYSNTLKSCDFDVYRKIREEHKVSEEQIFNTDKVGVPIIQTHKQVLPKEGIKEVRSITSVESGKMC